MARLAEWSRRHPALARKLDTHACIQLAETEAALEQMRAEAHVIEQDEQRRVARANREAWLPGTIGELT